MNEELEKFIRMSKYAGERFDLVQAGSGNSSVKLKNNIMLVKASGFLLSDVEHNKGYVKVDNKKVMGILENNELLKLSKKERDSLVSRHISDAVIESDSKPSIETFLHALLSNYTLHIHPIAVNAVTCRQDWKEILKGLFDKAVMVNYKTPGIDLALELKKEVEIFIDTYEQKPKVIFLQNHGLIVTSDNFEDIWQTTEDVLEKTENCLNIDLSKYKLTTKISGLLNKAENNYLVSYLSDDIEINKILKTNKDLFFTQPFCPDKMVFCGINAAELKSLDDIEAVRDYKIKYNELPKVLIFRDNIFFAAKNIRKARESEEIFKFHLLALTMARDSVNYLSTEETSYIGNWEAEKYRQRI